MANKLLKFVVALCLRFILHWNAHLPPPHGGRPVCGDATWMTQRSTRWVQRGTWSLWCKYSMDVASMWRLTVLATSLESLHLRLHVPHFSQVVCIFAVLATPPRTGGPPVGGGSLAQTVTGPYSLVFHSCSPCGLLGPSECWRDCHRRHSPSASSSAGALQYSAGQCRLIQFDAVLPGGSPAVRESRRLGHKHCRSAPPRLELVGLHKSVSWVLGGQWGYKCFICTYSTFVLSIWNTRCRQGCSTNSVKVNI